MLRQYEHNREETKSNLCLKGAGGRNRGSTEYYVHRQDKAIDGPDAEISSQWGEQITDTSLD